MLEFQGYLWYTLNSISFFKRSKILKILEILKKLYNNMKDFLKKALKRKPKGEQKEESETAVLLLDMILSHTTDV
jgi:hypothetical protein